MNEAAALVESARAGDASAWRTLYLRHAAAVRRLVSGFAALTRDDVEDLVQETFAKAYERLDALKDPARLEPWLLTIARSKALDRLAKLGRERRAVRDFLEDPAVGPLAPRLDPLHRERELRIQIVRELIDALPEGPERETVHLFYVDGRLTAREIAERLGVGKSTVTMRLERFRAKVKRRLAARLARALGEGS
ncbi:MAG: sigma-70 family RNA polymerase sigma factor [Deltaproteobacteria bacterium]|nr:MAG: sigma-70 family RNA polymerase sigma factor [Deltaproteobacteria bacterium]